ncbi:MAG: LytTR family DNA-binding domain-containing protein [Saprospiraceae bacterium]
MEVLNLKTLIVDDEPLAHGVILNLAKDVPVLDIVGQSYTAIHALDFLKRHPVDLIFLDIQMPKLKGLDFLRILDPKPLVIITSAYEQYALESFSLDVIDYLLKPFRFDRFLKAVHKAVEMKQLKTNMPSTVQAPSTSAPPHQLFIKSDKKYIQINIEAIYYLESHGNYVKVWMGTSYHLTPKTLTSFEEVLPPTSFMRIHKSFIVNKRYIHYLEGNQLVMQNDKALSLGRNYQQAIKQLIANDHKF